MFLQFMLLIAPVLSAVKVCLSTVNEPVWILGSTACTMMSLTTVVNYFNNTNYSPVDIAIDCHNAGYYNGIGLVTNHDCAIGSKR